MPIVSELHTGSAPWAESSTRPMSWGPLAGQIVGSGGSTRPFATSHAAVAGSALRRHTMLPLGLRKRSPTEAAGRAAVAKLVYASSINANGLPLNPHPVLPSRYPWDEDEPAVIADAYSLSKQANEAAAVARLGALDGVAAHAAITVFWPVAARMIEFSSASARDSSAVTRPSRRTRTRASSICAICKSSR